MAACVGPGPARGYGARRRLLLLGEQFSEAPVVEAPPARSSPRDGLLEPRDESDALGTVQQPTAVLLEAIDFRLVVAVRPADRERRVLPPQEEFAGLLF